jgi:hypothetical protein
MKGESIAFLVLSIIVALSSRATTTLIGFMSSEL